MALPQDRPVRGGGELSGVSSGHWPDWLWIALTVGAASFQAARTAAQKWLSGRLTTAAATYVRYLFALPVAALYALLLVFAFGGALPTPGWPSFAWACVGAIGQIGGTFFLLKALEARNFAVGVAYSKTDVVQAALFEAAVMGATVTWGAAAGIAIATFAVMLMSARGAHPLRSLAEGVFERSAVFGLLSGASLAVSGVAVRGAVLALEGADEAAGAVVALLTVLTIQIVTMGVYLLAREPASFGAIGRSWKASLFAGVVGGLGSLCWFFALGLQQVAYVRTLGLVEILATVALSRFLFKEHPKRRELVGIVILLTGIALVLNSG